VAEYKRREWRKDPAKWVADVCQEQMWSKQRTIMSTVAENRKTAIRSCHAIGKSFAAARLVGWWLTVHPPGDAFVVTTAPTFDQVVSVLWREIGRVHSKLPPESAGVINQTQWRLPVDSGKLELVAFGRKPADHNAAAFQGIHALNVLMLFDEACGISNAGGLWDAAESLIANETSKMVLFGNPDLPQTEFEKACEPNSGYKVIGISAFDTPIFTGEAIGTRLGQLLISRQYVEDRRRKWAPNWQWSLDGKRVECPEGADPEDTHPYWQSKVLGKFPSKTMGGLIPLEWVVNAANRELPKTEPIELGVDVGGGGDASTVGVRWGSVFRVEHSDHNPDTMETCGKVVQVRKRTKATKVKVDIIGIGHGMVDRGLELKEPFVGVNVSLPANDTEHYANRRAEGYYGLRERFESGDIDIDVNDEELQAELISIRSFPNSRGQNQIESKAEAKIMLGQKSPNKADCCMLAFLPDYTPAKRKAGFVGTLRTKRDVLR